MGNTDSKNMDGNDTQNKLYGGSKSRNFNNVNDVRSIIENIVRYTSNRANDSDKETIDMTSKLSDTIGMSSIDEERERIMGGKKGTQRQRFLRVSGGVYGCNHMHGSGCGCAGSDNSYAETSSFSVGGGCGVPKMENPEFKKRNDSISSLSLSSDNNVFRNSRGGGCGISRPENPEKKIQLSATSSNMMDGVAYSATSSFTGGNQYSATSSFTGGTQYSATSSYVESHTMNNNTLNGGSYTKASNVISTTSASSTSSNIKIELEGGANDKKTDSSSSSSSSSSDDNEDSSSSSSDSDESKSEKKSVKTESDKKGGMINEYNESSEDVLIDTKYVYTSSDSRTFYGSDESNSEYMNYGNRH
jgi:hypothetical protein